MKIGDLVCSIHEPGTPMDYISIGIVTGFERQNKYAVVYWFNSRGRRTINVNWLVKVY